MQKVFLQLHADMARNLVYTKRKFLYLTVVLAKDTFTVDFS